MHILVKTNTLHRDIVGDQLMKYEIGMTCQMHYMVLIKEMLIQNCLYVYVHVFLKGEYTFVFIKGVISACLEMVSFYIKQ